MGVSLDRFSGALLGQCLGDALGFVVEGTPPDVCELYVDAYVRHYFDGTRSKPLAIEPFTFGQYSDDSQLAREMLASWVARGAFDGQDYAGRIARLFSTNRVVGRGIATDRAASRLAAGVPWTEAGEPAPSAGNGSAMRAAPVGMMLAEVPALVAPVAVEQGRITHHDPRASAGAAAVAQTVALALTTTNVATDQYVDAISEVTAVIDTGFAQSVGRLKGWLRLKPAAAAVGIAAEGQDGASDGEGISPFVVGSVLWSLYSFLRSPEEYEEVVATAIRAGGDVDTTAAMAGAMAGARRGLARLPAQAQLVHDMGEWNYEQLQALCSLAHRVAAGGRASRQATGPESA